MKGHHLSTLSNDFSLRLQVAVGSKLGRREPRLLKPALPTSANRFNTATAAATTTATVATATPYGTQRGRVVPPAQPVTPTTGPPRAAGREPTRPTAFQ